MSAGNRRLIASLCAAEVLTMVGVFAFPALLPQLVGEWSLSKSEAGWIAGIFFLGYALAAPPVLLLTDRIDARLVYAGGAMTAALSAAGFALFAAGFWSALLLRALAGAALASTYMPGVRALHERYRGATPSRAIALYTATFSLGTAVSFFAAGEITASCGWRATFAAAAAAAAVAAGLALGLSREPPRVAENRPRLLDFRPVLADRTVRGYILAYGVHCWELFTLRSWLVALLAFAAARSAGPSGPEPSPTTVAGLSGIVAMAASFGGNELCLRFGRRRVVFWVMLLSAAAAAGIGFTPALSYAAVVGLALAYSALVQLDSAALTAGAVAAAPAGRQGATLAVYALFGFGCAGLGPLLLGVILDLTGGGRTVGSWGLSFASVAVVGLLGPLALRPARHREGRARRSPG